MTLSVLCTSFGDGGDLHSHLSSAFHVRFAFGCGLTQAEGELSAMCQGTKSLRDRQLKWDHGRGDRDRGRR